MNYISFIFSIISLIAFVQAWDVRICARSCSDGSTYTNCVEVAGLLSQDCHEAIHCPSPLYDNGWAYQFKPGVSFETISECTAVLDKMRKDPNLPVIVTEKYRPPAFRRYNLNKREQDIAEAMKWHSDISLYTPEEQLELGQRIISASERSRDTLFSEEETRDLGRTMFEFVHRVRELTNKSGVYTNSKCAGCSFIVQSIEEKLKDKGCSSISSVIKSTLCASAGPVLESFCNIVIDATEFEALVSTICQSALSTVVQGLGVREQANLLCSTLTCTNQPEVVSSKSSITGRCDLSQAGSDTVALNRRCDQLIAICDMAEKGFCLSDTIKEIKDEMSGGFVEVGIQTLANIVVGKTPSVVENVKKLATQCSKVKCGGGDDDDDDSTISLDEDLANPSAPVLSITLAMVFVILILSHF